jgi:hypothetical protein
LIKTLASGLAEERLIELASLLCLLASGFVRKHTFSMSLPSGNVKLRASSDRVVELARAGSQPKIPQQAKFRQWKFRKPVRDVQPNLVCRRDSAAPM